MRLAARSVPRFDRPVTLPPGRASEATRPLPIGSPAVGKTIRLEPGKLGRDLDIALGASLAPTVLDCDGAALDPAEFAQPPNKCVNPRALACSPPPRRAIRSPASPSAARAPQAATRSPRR